MWRSMAELNVDQLSDDKLDLGQFGTGMPSLPCLACLLQAFRTKAVKDKTRFLGGLFGKITCAFEPRAARIPCLLLQPLAVHNMLISHAAGAL